MTKVEKAVSVSVVSDVATVTTKTKKGTVKLTRNNSKEPKSRGRRMKQSTLADGGVPVINPYTRLQGMTHFFGNQPMLAATWKYKQLIVSPIFWVSIEAYDGTAAEYQVQQMEPFSLPVCSFPALQTNDNPFITIFDKNYRAALLDIKSSKSDAQTEMQRDMDALGSMGRGGFFTEPPDH